MTPIKLVDHSGDILGAILVPDDAREALSVGRGCSFYMPKEIKVFNAKPEDEIRDNKIIIVPAPMRDDAVMIAVGSIYDFEKCRDCFFIPGYAFTMKGRR